VNTIENLEETWTYLRLRGFTQEEAKLRAINKEEKYFYKHHVRPPPSFKLKTTIEGFRPNLIEEESIRASINMPFAKRRSHYAD